VVYTSRKEVMGVLVNHRLTTILAWIVAGIVVGLNVYLLYQTLFVGG